MAVNEKPELMPSGAGLASAIAIASAWKSKEVPTDVVAIGEIGLAGELRRVRDMSQRLAEAARLGFRGAIVPMEPGGPPGHARNVDGLRVVCVSDLEAALRALDLARAHATPLFTTRSQPEGAPLLGLA